MSLSPEELDALEALALKATPGPWHAPGLGEVHSDHEGGVFVCKDSDGEDDPVIADLCTRAHADENAEYIAAAYPQAVLTLIRDLREQRDRAEAWRQIADQRGDELTEARQEIATLKLQAEALSEARMLADREAAECREKLDEGEGYCAALTESLEEQTKLLWSLGHCDTCHGTGKMQGFVGYRYDGEEITEECECGECHGASVRTAQQIQGTPQPEGSKAE